MKTGKKINILVINCGSSSVKFQLIEMTKKLVLAKGIAERLGQDNSIIKFKIKEREFDEKFHALDHGGAIAKILDVIADPKNGILGSKDDIAAVGHRVVHGAEQFTESVLIDDDTVKQIEACVELAPLHNPHNLKGIRACQELLPGKPQIAVFDTAFHQTIPDFAYMYALPYRFYEKHRFRRYGFHGTSHFYVAHRAAEIAGKSIKKLKIVTCHLGNGASITAVKFGKSVDTSMGFTPLEGLIMGTRCGDVDPAMPLFVMEKEKMTPEQCDSLMNKESGLKGVTGISPDMRDLIQAYQKGNDRARLALEMYCYRIKKYVGMYAAAMNGVDIIVFTGGIGENATVIRSMCCKDLNKFGLKFDEKNNKKIKGKEGVISLPNSKVLVVCIPTNEELVIARDTAAIIQNPRS